MTRNILITGGNSGIGLEMARSLVAMGDRVIIASRSGDKSAAAVASVNAGQPNAKIESMSLDLADFPDIDRFAAELLKTMPRIDILILNAGLYTLKLRRLANGYEAMMGVMHFGHFRLTQHLLDAVKAAPNARIVVTSSVMHHRGKIDEASFTDPGRHRMGLLAYGQAKLANILFTRELARRLKDSGVTVNSFHPGAVGTDIYRDVPRLLRPLLNLFMLTPAQGADTGTWLATSPEVAHISGEYFAKRKRKSGSALSQDEALAARLWTLSEQEMKQA